MFIMVLLFYTFIIPPYKLSFIDTDGLLYVITDYLVDFFFLIDIFMNFFMAYYDKDHVLIDKNVKVAWSYFTGWFIIDSLAIFPADLFFS